MISKKTVLRFLFVATLMTVTAIILMLTINSIQTSNLRTVLFATLLMFVILSVFSIFVVKNLHDSFEVILDLYEEAIELFEYEKEKK